MAALLRCANSPAISSLIWRLFWVGMLIAHLPGWWQSIEHAAGARAAFLSASLVLFVLKVADVAWLRVGASPRKWLVISVAVLLLHGDIVRRNYVRHGPAVPFATCTLAAAAAVFIDANRRRRSTGRRATCSIASMLASLCPCTDVADLARPTLCRQALLAATCPNRAPPR